MSTDQNTASNGPSFLDLLILAALIVGAVLLIRFLAKSHVAAPAVGLAKTPALPFSPWFPLR